MPIAPDPRPAARDLDQRGHAGMPFGQEKGADVAAMVTAICPYLLAENGAWKASRPTGEHRCHAVRPPALLTSEQQRRLCLVAAHASCPTFLEARRRHETALADAGVHLDRLAARRTIALTRPVAVVLDRPSIGPHVPVIVGRSRHAAELALLAVLLLAAALLVVARLTGVGLLGTA